MSRLKIFRSAPDAPRASITARGFGPKSVVRIGVLGLFAILSGCAASAPGIPEPRPIVIHSGARIRADRDRMQEVNEWVTREEENIREDPSFMVVSSATIEEVFPWEDLHISNDSVTVQMPLGGNDAQLIYQIYAHLHLMVEMDRQEEWLPEAPTAAGYELERAILKRCADAWVLGRTVFDTQPFGPMDELAYASEAGHLDAFIFTARPDEFAESRAEYVRANPSAMQDYRDWFVDTFSREPPGLRSE